MGWLSPHARWRKIKLSATGEVSSREGSKPRKPTTPLLRTGLIRKRQNSYAAAQVCGMAPLAALQPDRGAEYCSSRWNTWKVLPPIITAARLSEARSRHNQWVEVLEEKLLSKTAKHQQHTMIRHLQEAMIKSCERLTNIPVKTPLFGCPPGWSRRRRTLEPPMKVCRHTHGT